MKLRQRGKLNELFAKKGSCDDVIIVRNGLITDSSYANLIFFDGREWITPKVPLLEGTCRARLLASGKIKTGNIGYLLGLLCCSCERCNRGLHVHLELYKRVFSRLAEIR